MAGGTAKDRFCHPPSVMYGWSTSTMSNAGIGNGKCCEFQNQSRFSSDSRRCSSNSAQYGYISCQPSQPAGVSIENGLGKSVTSALLVATPSPLPGQVRLSSVRTLVISDLHLGTRLR